MVSSTDSEWATVWPTSSEMDTGRERRRMDSVGLQDDVRTGCWSASASTCASNLLVGCTVQKGAENVLAAVDISRGYTGLRLPWQYPHHQRSCEYEECRTEKRPLSSCGSLWLASGTGADVAELSRTSAPSLCRAATDCSWLSLKLSHPVSTLYWQIFLDLRKRVATIDKSSAGVDAESGRPVFPRMIV